MDQQSLPLVMCEAGHARTHTVTANAGAAHALAERRPCACYRTSARVVLSNEPDYQDTPLFQSEQLCELLNLFLCLQPTALGALLRLKRSCHLAVEAQTSISDHGQEGSKPHLVNIATLVVSAA